MADDPATNSGLCLRGCATGANREATKFLKKRGFCLLRAGKGSHQQWIGPDQKSLVTLYYLPGGQSYPVSTMESIVRQSNIPKKEWLEKV